MEDGVPSLCEPGLSGLSEHSDGVSDDRKQVQSDVAGLLHDTQQEPSL